MAARNYPNRSVTIRPDQAAWLDAHPWINLSKLVQMKLDEQIALDPERQKNGFPKQGGFRPTLEK